MTRYLLFIFLTLFFLPAFAQQNKLVTGKVLDKKDQQSLPGASIVFINQKDSLQKIGTISDEKGQFSLKAKSGIYHVTISFIGYKNLTKEITIQKNTTDLGTFHLILNQEILEEIKVVETLTPTKQKGDTTIFNPDAYKVNPDATAEELLAKMPGFYSVDGKLLAQGKEVKEVLVDGQKFFGNNVEKALETIPTDVIKNVELYEYESDKAKFSGFKDKEQKKTVNIVTDRKKNKMVFGRIAAGLGKNEKYAVNGAVNQFTDNNRITISAKSKNVSAPLRLKLKNTKTRTINGNDIQQNNLGFNYNLNSKKGNQLAASYYMSDNGYKSKSSSMKLYTSDPLIGQTVNTFNHSDQNRNNQNLNLNYQMTADPKHMFSLNANGSMLDSDSDRTSVSTTKKDGSLLNQNENRSRSNRFNKNLDQSLSYMRNLNDDGRSFSIMGTFGFREMDVDGKQISQTTNNSDEITQSINRISDEKNTTSYLFTALSFSDKLSDFSHYSIGYQFSYNQEDIDNESFNFDQEKEQYSLLDTLTSNQFESRTNNHSAQLSYTIDKEKYRFMLASDFQFTQLNSKERFPNIVDTRKEYFAIMPTVNYNYKINSGSNLDFTYSLNTSNPMAKELQEVMNVSNPLHISMGNSDLKQAVSHNFNAHYTSSNSEKGTFTSVYLTAAKTNNIVGQKTIVASQDTLIMDQYFLPQGGQFSQPVNLDGQYNIRLRTTYGLPIKKLKSKLNISSRASFQHNPNLINQEKTFTNSLSLDQEFSLSSNISHRLDFTISSESRYSKSKSSGSSFSGSEYFAQNSSLSLYWNFYKKLNLKTNASHEYRNNYGTKITDNNWLLNIGISSKLFKNKRGEISLVAYDILNSSDSRRHTVRELYTIDTYSPKLNHFYMLSFSYKLRSKKGKSGGNSAYGMM